MSPGEREDRANRWVLIVFALIGLLLVYLPAYTDRTAIWTVDGDAVRWLGVMLLAAGGALRIWPVFVLGRRVSGLVAIQPGHELVTRVSMASFAIRAIWGCSLFVPASAYYSRRTSFPRSWRASAWRRRRCGRSSALSTTPIAAGGRG